VFDTVILNGRVCDGTGNPWTRLDVGVRDGRITALGRLSEVRAGEMVDAHDMVVAPGFIDAHAHSDLLCLRPEIHKIKVTQGVTSEVVGQDGISVAPVSEDTKGLWREQQKGLNGDIGEWPWGSVDEYLRFLDGSSLVGNVAYLVPHGAVRTLAMGFEGRRASTTEVQRMRELVEDGMRQGAFGVSTGLVYPPNVFSDKKELVAICEGAAAYDGCFMVHIRNESSRSLESLDEVIDVARRSRVRLHISHFKVAGRKNRDKFGRALEKLDAAREEGVEVTFDQYPYTAGSTMLSAVLPPWAHAGGTEAMLGRLQDPDEREKIKRDFLENEEYENWILNCGWENVIVSSVPSEKNRDAEGKDTLEIAEMRGHDPADAVLDLLLEERAAATMVVHWGSEEDIAQAMSHPLQSVGSDGIFGGKPHPRLHGTFARVLGHYVRDKGILALEEAIRRMTGATSQTLRLRERGFLLEGCWADLVVFDPVEVSELSTYDHPSRDPAGIRHVLVNGEWAVREGVYKGVTAGRALRRRD
jgi:N-acyl-D-amino-acid deacylase